MSIPNTKNPCRLNLPHKENPLPITPPLLLPSTPTTTTTLPHRRRPNRTTLLLRLSIPKRVPKIPPFRLNRPSRSRRTTRRSRARVFNEAIETIRSAFGARLDGFGGLGCGKARGGCQICFCYLDIPHHQSNCSKLKACMSVSSEGGSVPSEQ